MNATVVALTRVAPPRVHPGWIVRDRLQGQLDRLTQDYPLVGLWAGAGFGKTSLLAAWSRQAGQPTAWYSVADGDDDLYLLLVHLLAALEQRLDSPLLSRARERLQQDGVEASRWRGPTDLMLNALAMAGPTRLVIDDAHRLRSPRIQAFFQYLVEYLPESTGLILSARRPPAWPEWDSWQARGLVGAVDARALAFDQGEVDRLLSRRPEPTDPERGERLLAVTGGWPLAVDYLARTGKPLDALSVQSDLEGLVATQIWTDLSEDLREFLSCISVLDELTRARCEAVLAAGSGTAPARRAGDRRLAVSPHEAERHLAFLAEEGLLVQNETAGTYRLHQLLRDFIRPRLARDPGKYRLCLVGAAEVLLTEGQSEEAVALLAQAEETERVRALVVAQAESLLARGRHERLLELLTLLPGRDGRLELLRGSALRQAHRYDEALEAYQQAAEQAESDADLVRRALAGQAQVFLDTLQPSRMGDLLRRAYRLTPRDDCKARAELLEQMAENAVNAGRSHQARRWLGYAQGLWPRVQARSLEARILLRSGQLQACWAVVGRSADEQEERALEAHREAALILAYLAAHLGRVEEAELLARQGLELARGTDSHFTEAVAWMRLGHALQLRGSERYSEAEECYSQATRLLQSTGVPRLLGECLMGHAVLHAHAGQTAVGLSCATEGLARLRDSGDAWLSAYLRLTAGIVARLGGLNEADHLLEGARQELERCRDAFGVCLARLWLDPAQASPLARTAGYGFLVEAPCLLGPRTLRATPAPPTARLQVQLLGPLTLVLDGQEVPPRSWKRKKARELFALLALHHQVPSQKEWLMDLLWPDADADAADRDFRVALHNLGSVLEPDRPRKAPSEFLERRDSAYRLVGLDTDVDVFQENLEQARRAQDLELWRQALSHYRGDLLEDFPYCDWCTAERERLRSLYFETACRTAELALNEGRPELALEVSHQLLTRDKTLEEAYQLLMRAHLQQGQTGLALKIYEQCVAVLADELGLDPGPATRELHRQAIAGH